MSSKSLIVARVVLTGILFAAGISKLLIPAAAGPLGRELEIVLAWLELCVGAFLWIRIMEVPCCSVALGIAAIGGLSGLLGAEKHCGCMGGLEFGVLGHAILASATGLCALRLLREERASCVAKNG